MKSLYQSIIVLSLIIVLVFVGCQPSAKESKLFGEVITKTNISETFKKLRDDQEFTSEDFEDFTNGLTRLVTLSQDSLLGKSVGQIIKEQKVHQRDQIAATAANQAIKVELVLNHDFKYVGMKPTKIDTQDNSMKEIDFMVYEITNKSGKEISNVQGALQFYNKSNEVVKVYPIASNKVTKDQGIKPGETKQIAHPFDHDLNNVRDQTIRNDHQNLIPIWICTSIEFKDGTKIAVTNTL